jgi:hypothetical protein
MKKAKITFLPIDGSGAVHIDFAKGPFGDATESKNGIGVGFFDSHDRLLGVTFDDVCVDQDHQILDFGSIKIELKSKKGKISFKMITPQKSKKAA